MDAVALWKIGWLSCPFQFCFYTVADAGFQSLLLRIGVCVIICDWLQYRFPFYQF